MALTILLLAAAILILSYRKYVRHVDQRIIQPDPNRATPARRRADGMDFGPTKAGVMFGYQFKSLTLDPIIGPVIAIQFGWLPVLLWLAFGAVFGGWLQSYAGTIMVLRNSGASLGELLGRFISPRSRPLFLALIYIYLLLVIGAFGSIVTPLLAREGIPLSFLILILAGVLAGQMIYRWRAPLSVATGIAVTIVILGIYTGSTSWAENLTSTLNSLAGTPESGYLFTRPFGYGEVSGATFFWTIAILLFCYLGAVTPIWRFTQPINYVAFWFIVLTAGLSIIGIFIATLTGSEQTAFEIPPIVTLNQPSLGPIWPILFVTMTCGAVSGWHGLVCGYSTARNLEKETDAMPVSAGATLSETILPLLGLIFAAALGVASGRYDPNQNFSLVAGPAGVYANGLAVYLNAAGMPLEWGNAISTVFLTVIVLTVLPLVLRFMRMAGRELLGDKIPAFKQVYSGTLIAAALSLGLILFGLWPWTWVLFGGANQLIAAILLLLASVWLAGQAKPYRWTYWPAIFLTLTSVAALIYVSLYKAFYQGILVGGDKAIGTLIGHSITAFFGTYMLLVALVIFLDGMRALSSAQRRGTGPQAPEGRR